MVSVRNLLASAAAAQVTQEITVQSRYVQVIALVVGDVTPQQEHVPVKNHILDWTVDMPGVQSSVQDMALATSALVFVHAQQHFLETTVR